MNAGLLVILLAALEAALLAAFVATRDLRSRTHRAFALGMVVLAVEACFAAASVWETDPQGILFWQRLRSVATAILPGAWLVFGLALGRGGSHLASRLWRAMIAALSVVPLIFPAFSPKGFITDSLLLDSRGLWSFHYGWAGIAFHVALLLGAVLVLFQMEQTLRSIVGSKRWQVKFLLVGVGGIFAVRVYTASQVLLFSTWTSTYEVLQAGALVFCSLLASVSFVRTKVLDMEVYLSPSMLLSSLVVLLVGAYLILVGLLAELVRRTGGVDLPVGAFLVFLACMALGVVLLSDDLRASAKRFILRHLKRPIYDYRALWSVFGERTSRTRGMGEFCDAVVRTLSETMGVPSVTLWLSDSRARSLSLGASTALTQSALLEFDPKNRSSRAMLEALGELKGPVVLSQAREQGIRSFALGHGEFLRRAQVDCVVPLRSQDRLQGLLTLSVKQIGEPYHLEDLELLGTLAGQVAARLLSIRLAQAEEREREMAAFQALSAFFVHDLKNLAGNLSLLLQNIPVHYQNPEFRKDALALLARNVEKINSTIERLSAFREGLKIEAGETDLDQFVGSVLEEMNGALGGRLKGQVRSGLRVSLDQEQMRRVLVNLILNAHEASGEKGGVVVGTWAENGWAVVEVSDKGCGMSEEFLRESLFRPFRTTKKRGLGIGLYQSKAIVEAHNGKIEVESRLKEGTRVRVFLPAR